MMVTVYSTPSCPYCTLTKDFLNENEIEFRDVDVSEDMETAKEMFEKSGKTAVPQIDIDGTIIIGFDKDLLTEKLDL